MNRVYWAVAAALAVGACGTDDPAERGPDTSGSADAARSDAATDTSNADDVEATPDSSPSVECSPADGWYSPEVGGETWAGEACVSDSGEYVQVEENVASIGRINAFEQIAELLWRSEHEPTVEDFIAARELYAADEGLDSRVQRREDEHYPPVTDNEGNVLRCRDAGVPELDPNRCVGPALILPIINQAFADGINGVEPRLAAARIEASLLWFIYTSIYKESRTCATTPKDSDSAWAKYTGGQQREGEIGLAREFSRVSPTAHDAVFDGLLAVRCWRDIDSAPTAEDLELQDRATEQLDQALHFGFSRMLIDRLQQYSAADSEQKARLGAFIEVAAPVLLREVRERSAEDGVAYEQLLSVGPAAYDAASMSSLLLDVFECP